MGDPTQDRHRAQDRKDPADQRQEPGDDTAEQHDQQHQQRGQRDEFRGGQVASGGRVELVQRSEIATQIGLQARGSQVTGDALEVGETLLFGVGGEGEQDRRRGPVEGHQLSRVRLTSGPVTGHLRHGVHVRSVQRRRDLPGELGLVHRAPVRVPVHDGDIHQMRAPELRLDQSLGPAGLTAGVAVSAAAHGTEHPHTPPARDAGEHDRDDQHPPPPPGHQPPESVEHPHSRPARRAAAAATSASDSAHNAAAAAASCNCGEDCTTRGPAT